MALKKKVHLYFILVLFLLSAMGLCETKTCTVTVVDTRIEPIPDAEIIAYEGDYDQLAGVEVMNLLCQPCKTNQHGRVTLLLDYKRSRSVMVIVRKSGYAIGWDMLPYREVATPHINIVLDQPIYLAGCVIDDQGRPLAGVSVQAQPKISKMRRLEQRPVLGPVDWMTAHTDSEGRFRFDCFGQDVRADFLVTATGSKTIYKYTSYYLSSCGYEVGRDDICLRLPKQTSLHIQVVDDKGEGIADMTAVVSPDHRDKDFRVDYAALRSVTDKDGHCTFENIPLNKHFLKIPNTDISVPWVDKTLIIDTTDSKDKENILVQLERGTLVQVMMLDESTQEPIRDMYLRFSQEPSDPNEFWFSRGFYTDADGKVKLIAPAGLCNFRYWDERYEERQVELPVIEKGKPVDVRFTLTPKKPITGRVEDSEGNPVADVLVKMTWGQTTLTDSKGTFQCTYDNLREGMCLIARDIGNNQGVISPIGNPDEPAVLTLKPAKTLTGKVVDPDDVPIPAARVEIKFDGPGYLSDCCPEILTDKEGQFEVKAIPADVSEEFAFRISVVTMNHGSLTYKKFQIKSENDEMIELEPIEMHPAELKINGFVLDEEGNPAIGIPVFLQGDGQYHQSAVTDENGRFEMRRLCEGQIRLQGGIGGSDFKPGRVTAHSGDTDIKVIIGQDRVHEPEVSLTGRKLPDFNEIEFENTVEKTEKKSLLLCFWDYQQRSSRHGVSELVKLQDILTKNDIELAFVHTTVPDEKAKEWIQAKGTFFHVGHIPKESETVRNKWGVRGLPWLILTDAEHEIIAEGFSVNELEAKFGFK